MTALPATAAAALESCVGEWVPLSAVGGRPMPSAHRRIAGRGERDLIVPTDDGVDEPLNRRVEIDVR